MTPMRAIPKPAYARMQRATANLEAVREKASRRAAKDRDGWCCRRCGRGCVEGSTWLEAAHCEDEGMGGRASVSCERKHYVSLCRRPCHRDIIHGAKERMVFDPEQMGDGPVSFEPVTPKRVRRVA